MSENNLLILTEDQQMLAESAAEFVAAEAPVSRFRARRDGGHSTDPDLWAQLVDLGWNGVALIGLAELAVVMEALGRSLAQTPLVSVAAAAAIGEGEDGKVLAFGFNASCSISKGTITGTIPAVQDAGMADAFAVIATGQMYRVDATHAQITPLARIDCRDAAHVAFDSAPATLIDGSAQTWSRCRDWAIVAQCAEMLGTMSAAFDMTLAYVKEREQFGVKIGSFQVLKHRAVDMFIEIELCRSAVMLASRDPSPEHVSLAKARCNDAIVTICNEAIQLHGGIGMTDEHDIGFYLKRAMVSSQTLGTSAWHRDRYARERGY